VDTYLKDILPSTRRPVNYHHFTEPNHVILTPVQGPSKQAE